MLKKFAQFFRFSLVGLLNTILSYAVMQIAYNFCHWGYWGSSAFAYIVGAVFSFGANKRYTFGNKDKGIKVIIKYGLNIFICYLVAYVLAKPLVHYGIGYICKDISDYMSDQIAMLFGMLIYIVINFCGQKKFVFVRGD